jgi:hypothetical protein
MSDIEQQLLSQAARSYETTPSADVIEADVLRGRSVLLHRRRRSALWSSIGTSVAVAAIVGAGMLVGNLDRTEDTPAVSPDPATSQERVGVPLASYTGGQPEPAGFIVDWVPEGWSVQDSDHPRYELAIAPNGNTTDSDHYVGKLVVFLLGDQPVPDEEPVVVNGQPGVVDYPYPEDDVATTLTYRYPDGRYVQVQMWNDTLNWSNDQLIRFAEGIEVTPDARPVDEI